MPELHFISTNQFYKDVLEHIYKLNIDNIDDFLYLDELKSKSYRYGKVSVDYGKILVPGEVELKIQF